MISWIRIKYQWVQRFIAYGLNGANSYDFDCTYVYQDIALRLERCYVVFRDHGHLVWNNTNTNQMKKLQEAVGLAKWLSDYQLEDRHVTRVYDKYTTLNLEGGSFNFNYSIPEKLFQFYAKKACEKDRTEVKYNEDRLFYLLGKYGREWWD